MSMRPDWGGVRVVLRLDLNVPVKDGKVRDAFRLDQAAPTVRWLLDRGARVVVIAHLGKGKPEDTLAPVAEAMNERVPIRFVPAIVGTAAADEAAAKLDDGQAILLENLRWSEGEEANDPAFSDALARLGNVYVNDGFSVSHRAHASVVGIAERLESYMGPLLQKEVEHLSKALSPEHPFLFIVGGAKVSTKLPLIEKFLDIADHVYVGGANANNFFRARGWNIGASVWDEKAGEGLEKYLAHEHLVLPEEVVVREGKAHKKPSEVTDGEVIVDIGKGAVDALAPLIKEAKLIVWNGPLGLYEEGFTDGSKELLELIAGSGAMSIIGGGDTVALIDEMGAHERFGFVSTGGGAMLDFLADGSLPGLDVLKR
jgi:phosphoglycerate kinase